MKARTLLLIPTLAALITALSGLVFIHNQAALFEREFKEISHLAMTKKFRLSISLKLVW